MSEEDTIKSSEEFTDDDIFFECPRCGKSMGIAKEGEGMVVKCLGCGRDMRVPSAGGEAEHVEEDAVDQTAEQLEESEKPSHFDADYMLKGRDRDLVFEEVAAIQRSLDRIVATLDRTV